MLSQGRGGGGFLGYHRGFSLGYQRGFSFGYQRGFPLVLRPIKALECSMLTCQGGMIIDRSCVIRRGFPLVIRGGFPSVIKGGFPLDIREVFPWFLDQSKLKSAQCLHVKVV